MRRAKHKFRAVRTEHNGRSYASKAEARYAQFLDREKAEGRVLFWLSQVPIQLPGKTRYVVDFQVFTADGEVRFVDVKGVETETFRLKKRQVEDIYPITIEVVK